jgi:hypothetical protein
MSPDENSYSFLLWPKMMTATSTEQSTDSSCAFLNRPPLRFRKVLPRVSVGRARAARGAAEHGRRAYTERLRSSLMALISILRRPMVTVDAQAYRRIRRRRSAIRARCTVMGCGWCRRVLEEQKKLVLACAAVAATTAAAHEHVEGFRRPASGKGRRTGCVEKSTRDSATTYMSAACATKLRGSTHGILRLWV